MASANEPPEASPVVMMVPVMLAPSAPPIWRNMLSEPLATPP